VDGNPGQRTGRGPRSLQRVLKRRSHLGRRTWAARESRNPSGMQTALDASRAKGRGPKEIAEKSTGAHPVLMAAENSRPLPTAKS